MAKEEKPLEYERRILDTKGLAQRIDLGYLGRPHWLRTWRRRLTWILPLVAAAGAAPFVAGIAGGRKAFSNGPVSRSHAIFEKDCTVCHAQAFSRVSDAACKKCHDGPIHKTNAAGEAGCAQCHAEHRGAFVLALVDDRNCTRCHADLAAHGKNVRLGATRVTGFRPDRHPEFYRGKEKDRRPLRLNHAVHMPAQPKTIRNMKLPLQCAACHVTDRTSPTGDLLPVTFEQHCRQCHERELEFDVYQVLGAQAAPAPHTKDPKAIHEFITETYSRLLAADPLVARRPLGRDLEPMPNADAWLAAAAAQSATFLFERKCKYCHEYEEARSGFPVVRKVSPIRGHHREDSPSGGEPWLEHARFSHRAHRAAACASCHQAAASSARTEDVLVPKMASCLPCHGSTGALQDRCAQCHLYHDKTKERPTSL